MFVAVALIGTITLLRSDFDGVGPFEDGPTQAALEARFDDALILREVSIGFWGGVRWNLFHEAGSGAVAGDNDWLFTDEEYEALPGFEERLSDSLDTIAMVVSRFTADGVTVIPLLLPDKARIMREQVMAPRPPRVEARYDTLLAGLAEREVQVIDLRPVLSAVPQAYLRTDTHWTPEGARAVAGAIARPDVQVTAFATSKSTPVLHEGDLLAFVPTAPFPGPGAEALNTYDTIQRDSGLGADLFGDISIPGVLIGTSYSADSRWHFEGFLKDALEMDILNLAEEGAGPFAPIQAYLESEIYRDTPPEVVIWDIPERYTTLRQTTGDTP
ncbi:alginate O-acetyltransferase AlgX-related protein [Monaibacterium marinum]|nr:hypothetical protein [Monaibacterium marinum]